LVTLDVVKAVMRSIWFHPKGDHSVKKMTNLDRLRIKSLWILLSAACLTVHNNAFSPRLSKPSRHIASDFSLFGTRHHEIQDNHIVAEGLVSDSQSVSRRAAFVRASALSVGGLVLNTKYISGSQHEAVAYEAPLFEQVKAIENANRMGQFGNKIYEPNSNGAPEKHLPQVSIEPGTTKISVSVPHVMTEEHYIQFMWLKDTKTNDVVLVKAFPATDPSPPTLKVTVPIGVTLRPYLFCNVFRSLIQCPIKLD